MAKVQSRLIDIAQTKCLPYLLNLPFLKRFIDRIAFVVVGSVANGLCSGKSDIDIALLCDNETFSSISHDTRWSQGRPTEIILDGTQLHYYAIPIENIREGLTNLDDQYLYIYSTVIILKDESDIYSTYIVPHTANNVDIRRRRIIGTFEALQCRRKALESCVADKDIYVISQLCLELIGLILKATSLIEGNQYDPRKRPIRTALSGRIGKELDSEIRTLFRSIGTLHDMRTNADFRLFRFPEQLTRIMDTLQSDANKKGFDINSIGHY